MDERGRRAWLARHPPAARILASLDLTDAAIERVIAEYLAQHPDAKLDELRAHVRQRRGAKP